MTSESVSEEPGQAPHPVTRESTVGNHSPHCAWTDPKPTSGRLHTLHINHALPCIHAHPTTSAQIGAHATRPGDLAG